MSLLKKYGFFLVMSIIMGIVYLLNNNLGIEAFNVSLYSVKELALVLPPIFIMLGLLDVWVPKETIVNHMGEDSGIRGIILAILLGSAAAGPLYGAFPVAAVFMKKGVKLTNIFIFIGAWSTTKIPMFMFEMSSLGAPFAIGRLLIDIPGIIIMAYILSGMLSKEEKDLIYKKAEEL